MATVLNRYHTQQARATSPAARTAPASAPGGRILVVDGHADSRALLLRYLRAHGFEVWSAADASEALQVVRMRPVHLVVTELDLPEGGGFRLLRRLRHQQPALRAVALSAEEPEEGDDPAARFDAYLLKPVRLRTLLDVVVQFSARVPAAR